MANISNTRLALVSWAALCICGCAVFTMGYLGRRTFEHGPYYQTYARHVVADSGVIAHLPIQLDVIATDLPPGGARMLEPLLTAMNAYLDGAGRSIPLDSAPSLKDEAPWAYAGTRSSLARVESARGFWAPDAPEAGSGLPGMNNMEMVIQAKRASEGWSTQLAAIAATRRADYVLRITLGAAEYSPHSRTGLSLGKVVDLGTGNSVPVSWLTSDDQPAPVIHLVGLLLSRDGSVLRVGAEGILMQDPSQVPWGIFVGDGGISVGRTPTPIAESDLASLLASRRREDLEGRPLAWEVALGNLVRQLLGRP